MMSFNLFIAVAYVAITIIYAFYYYKKYHAFLESETNYYYKKYHTFFKNKTNNRDYNEELEQYAKFKIQFAKEYTIKKIKYTDIIISFVLIGISVLSVAFIFIPITVSEYLVFLVFLAYFVFVVLTLYFTILADYYRSRVILGIILSLSYCMGVGALGYCLKNTFFDFDEFNVPFILIIYTSMLFNLMITKFNDLYREKMYTKGLYEGWKLESESESQEE